MLIGIGLWASRKVKDDADFLLGGRNLGPVVAGLSYAASTSSAWVLLGYTGFVYTSGVSALWMVPGIWGGYVVMWAWFGPRVRAESAANRWITPTEFLCAHLGERSAFRVALLATALIAFCFVFYIAAQLDAAATAFVTSFGLADNLGLVIGAAIILVYCLLGGFWAASVTDTLQGIVMMLAALAIPALAVIAAGGPVSILSTLQQTDAAFRDPTGGLTTFLFVGFLLGLWGVGIGTLGQPHLLARLMAVRGERERRLGFAIALSWGVLVYIGMSWLALAARSLDLQPESGEQIFYLLAEALLPPVLAGIVIAAILSAVMSTVDSLLLAASASVSHDLRLADRLGLSRLWTSRAVMTIIVICAVLLGLFLPDSIFNRVLFAWNALGAAFGPLVVARVVGREPTGNARLVAIGTGFLLTVLFYSLGNVEASATPGALRELVALAALPGDPFERFVPFVVALVVVFAGSRRAPR